MSFKSKEEFQADINRIRKSKMFDEDWYTETYRDVGALSMDPVEHYVKFGADMRRDPNPNFSTRFYLDTHPGVLKKNLNPFATHLYRKGPHGEIQPDHHYTLWAASRVARFNGYERAITLAEKYLPRELQHTLTVLRANQALSRGQESIWLSQLNEYLGEFQLAPIELEETGPSLISRMTSAPLSQASSHLKVSVIMPAWNAEETVQHAARSILRQTWGNLELIIIDDCSQDRTWEKIKEISRSDTRVKILRNARNVGPYVSKNIGLQLATGDYITGQDADDWAVPQRLEKHIAAILASHTPLKASLGYMVRIRPDGYFDHIGKVTGFSLDGVCRKASISCMFERKTLQENLGHWDSVRFGADSEMISRATHLLGDSFSELKQITMICLDLESSLTNHPDHGVHKVHGVTPIRATYRDAWAKWHKNSLSPANSYLSFPHKSRRFPAPEEMLVPHQNITENLAHSMATNL